MKKTETVRKDKIVKTARDSTDLKSIVSEAKEIRS